MIPGVHFQTASCALVGEDTQRTGHEAARLQASDGIGSDTRADFQRSVRYEEKDTFWQKNSKPFFNFTSGKRTILYLLEEPTRSSKVNYNNVCLFRELIM